MSNPPQFTSDRRNTETTQWRDNDDWRAGVGSNVEAKDGKLFGRPPIDQPATGLASHAWSGMTRTKYENEVEITDVTPSGGEFTVDMEATQNGDHNGDESIRLEMGIRTKGADGGIIDTLSTTVTFRGGTRAGTTKSNSITGTTPPGTSWVLFIKGYHAPVTTYGPNRMNADASVKLYE